MFASPRPKSATCWLISVRKCFRARCLRSGQGCADEPGVRVRKVIALGNEYDDLLATADPKPMTAMAERHDWR